MNLSRIYVFEHTKFGTMEILVEKEEKRILFSNKFLKEKLKVKHKMLPMIGDTWITKSGTDEKEDVLVDFHEIFEYIKYSNIDEELRWDFEEWIAEIVQDLFKLI